MADRIFKYDKQQGTFMGWHSKTEVVETITWDTIWLKDWELVAKVLWLDGKPTKYRILEMSDQPGIVIGNPYNSETFKPIDNSAFLQLIKDSIAGTGHKIVSAGSVRNRGRVFVSVELAGMEKFKAAGREFSAYLNYGNGHDKTSVLWVNTSNTCTVCDNTFQMNLFTVENKEKKLSEDGEESVDLKISQRHTKNVLIKLPEIARLVDKAVGVQAEFALEMDKLSMQKVTKDEATELFAGFIGRKVTNKSLGLSTRSKNQVDRLVELFRNGKGNEGRNKADMFQGVTDWYTHYSSGGEETIARQFTTSEFGQGKTNKAEFWSLINNPMAYSATIADGAELLAASKN